MVVTKRVGVAVAVGVDRQLLLLFGRQVAVQGPGGGGGATAAGGGVLGMAGGAQDQVTPVAGSQAGVAPPTPLALGGAEGLRPPAVPGLPAGWAG